MTDQELFDRVAKHLLNQGEPAKDISGICRYRTSDGRLKCAIGCLIADENYLPSLEGEFCRSVAEAAGIEPRQYNLAERLQDLHDSVDPIHWNASLSYLAGDFHLNTDVLDG